MSVTELNASAAECIVRAFVARKCNMVLHRQRLNSNVDNVPANFFKYPFAVVQSR